MPAPDSVKKLLEEFERLKGGPPLDSFDEAQLCTSYVEPFWEALGWNVRDPREVVKEKRVHLRASTKHADYCFQLKGKPQFILEAKDYRKRLDDADFIFQTKRYGYNLPVDFGVLTNFAEFRLYDTGLQPLYENKARGLFKPYQLPYTEYEARWDELAAAFSREAVATGALRALLPKARRERNKEALDRKFFEGLNGWRAELARVVALRNPDVGVHDINEAVQRILDRAIFMRVIEDREIEAMELLLDALNRWTREKEKPLYRYIVDKFRYLEPQYNGELFEPHFSEDLIVDDKPLKEFIESLYYPTCPYQFNVVGVEMLGTIYERFLGSTIRLTEKHRAVVEDKPEVRKAGGVYYTPKYIVDYIVENTVGELLKKCKTPAAAAKLKILDPACGSGSFLLGAFRRLIDWHEDWFNANPEKISKGPAAECWWDAEAGRWRLGAKFKGQILVNNLFGVDIDPQACEVTRMSLYLKVLEDVNAQYLMKTALLPPLDNNIKCGNSLIGSDYWEVGETLMSVPPDEEERRRVNPFDWEVEFAEIMKAGGFDAVIGNPPWGGDIDYAMSYFHGYYPRSTQEYTDSFKLFVDRALQLAKYNGRVSLITPNSLLNQNRIKDVRALLLGYLVNEVVDLGEGVFDGAVVPSAIFVVTKAEPGIQSKFRLIDVRDKSPKEKAVIINIPSVISGELKQSEILLEDDFPFSARTPKVRGNVAGLGNSAEFRIKDAGINYQRVKVGMEEKGKSDLGNRLLYEGKKETDEDKMFWKGADIGRYWIADSTDRYCRPYFKKFIKKNEVVHLNVEVFNTVPKILIRQTADNIIATIDYKGVWFGRSIIAVIYVTKISHSLEYLLGLLNSKFLGTLYDNLTKEKGRVFAQVKLSKIKQLPIRLIDFSDPADVARHDKMVALVEEMLELHKRLAAAKSDADKQRLQRAIAVTDKKIDALVYELYGLTAEEIKIVEGASGP